MKKWVIASSNAGKLREFRELFAGSDIEIVAQSEFGVTDADETGLSFVENALLKARHAARAAGLPALADDSGLCVDALNGAPGLYSARYAGTHGDAHATSLPEAGRVRDAANVDKLLDALKDLPDAQRTAHFYAVIVLLRHAEDPQPLIAEGVWPGRVLHARRGTGGFGYDPVFFDPEKGLAAAELDPELKNRLSHRGRALAALRQKLPEAIR